ncbi:MAG TPA: hypothetical protein VGP31_10715 [Planosporangium sp.]|nr:hypothetical protein [Planosporangium sp.]
MRTPAYKLTLGRKVVDTTDDPQASTVVSLTVSLDMETPSDDLTLVLGRVDGVDPTAGDALTVELGYADDGSLIRVLTGTVADTEPGLLTRRVTGFSGAASLLRSTAERSYDSATTAGRIVRDLAGLAGVDVSTADDGITFPAYVVDGRRSLHRHLLDLAALCGFDLYLGADGKLVFQRYTGGSTVHVLEYAKDVLALDIQRTQPSADVVEAFGEGPSSGSGNAWAWLTKDFSASKGSAGSGTTRLLLERSALRTRDAALAAAEGALATARHRATRGRLRSVGRPEVKLGDGLRLRGVPDDSLNGAYQVRAVTHRITKRAGFTTTVDFRTAD